MRGKSFMEWLGVLFTQIRLTIVSLEGQKVNFFAGKIEKLFN